MDNIAYWDAPEPIRKAFDEFLLTLWRVEKPYWGKQEIAWRSYWFGRQSIVQEAGLASAPPPESKGLDLEAIEHAIDLAENAPGLNTRDEQALQSARDTLRRLRSSGRES